MSSLSQTQIKQIFEKRQEKPSNMKSMVVNSKVVEQIIPGKKRQDLQNSQRFQFSPLKQNLQENYKKPAWERLLEKSFDTQSGKQILEKYMQSQHCLSTTTSPKMYEALTEYSSRNGIQNKTGDKTARNIRSEFSPGSWQNLMMKTQDSSVKWNAANHSIRRNFEETISGRTINPNKYSAHANLMLETNPRKKSRAEQALEHKQSYETITGCTRKPSQILDKQFKLGYTQEELSQFLSTPKVSMEQHQERSHLKDAVSIGKSTEAYIGSPNTNILLSDRTLNGRNESVSKVLKNMRDFRSNINCLVEQSPKRNDAEDLTRLQSHRVIDQKFNRNLLTSFETCDVMTERTNKQPICQQHELNQNKKRVQQPYESKEIKSIFENSFAQMKSTKENNNYMFSPSKKKPSAIKVDAFRSQIQLL